MTGGNRFARQHELFEALCDLPEDEREARLLEACGTDVALLEQLRALIAADAQLADATARRVRLDEVDSILVGRALPPPQARVGPYELREEIGHGGMGRVFRAERADGEIVRQVAVKFVRHELLSPTMLERFRAERRVLARLEHPNIARLYDAATTEDGTPYYVMEYVRGESITTHVARVGLDLRQRIALMRQVCAAVSHAHRHLVVHRDIKPGNILVTEGGTPKLLDFGIAKVLADDAEMTSTADRRLTPQYAAPEQLRGEPIGVGCDVYALGLLIYELLAGTGPFVLEGQSAARVEQLVCEVPPAPPSRVARGLRIDRELDDVVLRCLRKAPGERYPSVEQLDADLENWLEGRPVQARGGHALYRARKFVRRHRVAVAASGAVVVSLVAGLIATTVARIDAERERDRAVATRAFLEEMIAAPDPWRLNASAHTRDVRVVDALSSAAAKLDASLVRDAGLRGEIGTLLGRTLRRLGQLDAAQQQIERAVAALTPMYDEMAPERIEAELELAFVRAERGEHADAQRLLEALLPRLERASGVRADYRDEARRVQVDLVHQLGDLDGAIDAARIALDDATVRHGADATAVSGARATLANLLSNRADWTEADALMTVAYENERRRLGPAHPVVLGLLSQSANIAIHKGDYTTAERRYREAAVAAEQALGPEHPDTLSHYAHVAMALDNAGDREAAIALFEQVLPKRTALLGEDHADVLTTRANYALTLRNIGRPEAADVEMGQVFERRVRVLGEAHPDTIRALTFRAALAKDRGDLERAEALLAQASELAVRANGRDHPDTLLTENNYFAVMRERGKLDRALAGYAGLTERAERVFPPAHWHLASIRVNYGRTLYLAGRYAEAEPLIVEGYRVIRSQFGAEDPRVLAVRARVQQLYELWGKPGQAARVLQDAQPGPSTPP